MRKKETEEARIDGKSGKKIRVFIGDDVVTVHFLSKLLYQDENAGGGGWKIFHQRGVKMKLFQPGLGRTENEDGKIYVCRSVSTCHLSKISLFFVVFSKASRWLIIWCPVEKESVFWSILVNPGWSPDCSCQLYLDRSNHSRWKQSGCQNSRSKLLKWQLWTNSHVNRLLRLSLTDVLSFGSRKFSKEPKLSWVFYSLKIEKSWYFIFLKFYSTNGLLFV